MTLLAHAGHWLTNVLYVMPLVAFGIWMAFTAIRDRRAARRSPDGPPAGREPPEDKRPTDEGTSR